MSCFAKDLVDSWSNIYIPEWRVEAEDLGLTSDLPRLWSIEKRVLHGGRQEGVDILVVDNGRLLFTVVPSRGMSIHEAWCEGVRLGWDSPNQEIVHPMYARNEEKGGLGFLRDFNGWFVRCGLTHNGAPNVEERGDRNEILPLHGRLYSLPASALRVEIDLTPPYTLRVRGIVCETCLFGENFRLETAISTVPGAAWLRVEDCVTNLSGREAQMQMLYHINYGPPLLGAGSCFLAPIAALVPRDANAVKDLGQWDRYRRPTPGIAERCYFAKLRGDHRQRTAVALRNARGDLAISQEFGLRPLPCFTLWKNEAAEADGYVTGLEPGTNYPNPISFERRQGRVVRLAPGAAWRAELSLELHIGRKSVTALGRRLAALAGKKPPEILAQPGQPWCA